MDEAIVELLSEFEQREVAEKPAASMTGYREFFEEFDTRWVVYRESHAADAPGLNIWDIATLGRDEVMNCRFLTWWLDPHGSHFQGSRFLNRFLEAADEPPLTVGEERSVRVGREVWVGENSRIDLVIETDSRRMWVEAKIQASECLGQISRYAERAQSGLGARRFSGRLLTIGGTSGETVRHGFRRMVWRDVVRALRQFSRVAANPFVAKLAEQHSEFLRKSMYP